MEGFAGAGRGVEVHGQGCPFGEGLEALGQVGELLAELPLVDEVLYRPCLLCRFCWLYRCRWVPRLLRGDRRGWAGDGGSVEGLMDDVVQCCVGHWDGYPCGCGRLWGLDGCGGDWDAEVGGDVVETLPCTGPDPTA